MINVLWIIGYFLIGSFVSAVAARRTENKNDETNVAIASLLFWPFTSFLILSGIIRDWLDQLETKKEQLLIQNNQDQLEKDRLLKEFLD